MMIPGMIFCHSEEPSFKTLTEGQKWLGCRYLLRQSVPDMGSSNRKSLTSNVTHYTVLRCYSKMTLNKRGAVWGGGMSASYTASAIVC